MVSGRLSTFVRSALFQRLLNLGLLIGGFGLGQGSIFLAQTVLVATGDVSLLAAFGTHFSFAMLGIIAVEAGSLTVLARHANAIIRKGGSQAEVWQAYWETTGFRLAMATLVVAAGLVHAFGPWAGDFSRAYVLAALPAFLVWAFNAAGFLDGLQKSGVAGLTGAIAYVASAVALWFARGESEATAGLMLGSALSIGYLVTVIAQQAALAVSGWRMVWAAPSPKGLRTAFREELAMLAGLLPGQFYFRIQLLVASLVLGEQATAILVYAKQIVGAGAQVTGFIRRIEFPQVLHRLADDPAATIGALLRIQRNGILAGGLLAAILLAGSLVVGQTGEGFLRQAMLLLSVFGLTILSESVGQALVQILFGHGHYGPAAIIRILAVTIGIAVSYLAVGLVGLPVFVLADFSSHATVIVLSILYLKRTPAKTQ